MMKEFDSIWQIYGLLIISKLTQIVLKLSQLKLHYWW